jgi:hypothetical protein
MNREAIQRLLVASGLAMILLFRATGTAPPLHAAPPSQPVGSLGSLQGAEDTTSEPSATLTPTPTATPSPTLTPTPTATPSPTLTPTPTATPSPTLTPTPTSTSLPSPLQSPLATPTRTKLPTSTPTPTRTPPHIPTPAATFTPVPTPPVPPTLSPFDEAITLLAQNPVWVAAICLIPLLVLGLVLVLWTLWRARPRPTPPPPPAPAGPYLESTATPGGQGRLHLKPDGVTIGQAPENDLVVAQDLSGWETVSRRHARIYAQVGRWIVEDLGSTNGIYVNGRRTGRNLLRDGWRLGVGGVEFVFHASTGEERQ